MKIRKLAISVILLALIICCAGVLIGCKKSLEPPYYVRLDVFQPDGQLLADKYDHYITLKYDGNPKVFDFKVYSIGQKRYINNDDIKDGTLNSKMRVSVKKETDSHHFPIDFEDVTTWPTDAGYYNVIIRFNSSVIGYDNVDLNYRLDDVRIYLTIENGYSTEIELYTKSQLYILNDAEHKVKFVAPENGNYTFSTYGNVENTIKYLDAPVIEIDEYNKQMSINLNKGEEIFLDVKKVNSVGSDYVGIEVEFTPEEIEKGQTKDLSIKPNEREFLMLNLENSSIGAFEFNISSLQEFTLDIYEWNIEINRYNFRGNSIQSAILSGNNKYFIAVSNFTSNIMDANVSVDEINIMNPQESLNMTLYDQRLIAIHSPLNAGLTIKYESNASIHMILYDDELNSLNETISTNTIKRTIDKDRNYYLFIQNYDHANSNVEISIDWNPYKLSLGDNNIKNCKEDRLLAFKNMDIEAPFKVTANSNFVIYDSSSNVLAPDSDGAYNFINEEVYYVITKEPNVDLNLYISLDYTDELNGTFSSSGVKYIKFVPYQSAAYNVQGSSNFSWYNSHLQSCHFNLAAGATYYLKIEGTPSTNYNVKILLNRSQVIVGRTSNVYSGYYYFNVTEAGIYSFRTYRSNTNSSIISIFDLNGNPLNNSGELTENLNVDDRAYEMYLPAGMYYIDIKVNVPSTWVGLSINKVKGELL